MPTTPIDTPESWLTTSWIRLDEDLAGIAHDLVAPIHRRRTRALHIAQGLLPTALLAALLGLGHQLIDNSPLGDGLISGFAMSALIATITLTGWHLLDHATRRWIDPYDPTTVGSLRTRTYDLAIPAIGGVGNLPVNPTTSHPHEHLQNLISTWLADQDLTDSQWTTATTLRTDGYVGTYTQLINTSRLL